MKLWALALTTILSAGVANAWNENDTVQMGLKDMVSNCLNGPLRWFPDHTIGCLTPRTSLLTSSEVSYLDSKGLRWLMQQVNWKYQLVIAKKVEKSPTLNEQAMSQWWGAPKLPSNWSTVSRSPWLPNRSHNPTPYIIHGAGEISINWQKVYRTP